MKTEKRGRREFIKRSAAASLAITIVPRHVLGGSG
ncbi:MAG: twin-arginine translocation signal domain-containing protein [Bacteroidales bacterium]